MLRLIGFHVPRVPRSESFARKVRQFSRDECYDAQIMSVRPVQEAAILCSNCAYDLRGLPSRHACPECGARFDLRITGAEPPPTLPPTNRLFLPAAILTISLLATDISKSPILFAFGLAYAVLVGICIASRYAVFVDFKERATGGLWSAFAVTGAMVVALIVQALIAIVCVAAAVWTAARWPLLG